MMHGSSSSGKLAWAIFTCLLFAEGVEEGASDSVCLLHVSHRTTTAAASRRAALEMTSYAACTHSVEDCVEDTV